MLRLNFFFRSFATCGSSVDRAILFKIVTDLNEDVHAKLSPQLRRDLSDCCVTVFHLVLGVCK